MVHPACKTRLEVSARMWRQFSGQERLNGIVDFVDKHKEKPEMVRGATVVGSDQLPALKLVQSSEIARRLATLLLLLLILSVVAMVFAPWQSPWRSKTRNSGASLNGLGSEST